MSTIKKMFLILVIMLVSATTSSATVDFSGLTDLINATMTILDTFVDNSSTLYGFFILMAGLALVSIIVFGFIGTLLKKMGKKLNDEK